MISYRLAAVDDAGDLARVRLDFLDDSGLAGSEEERARTLAGNLEFMEKSLADGSFVSWLAVSDGQIVGTSGISFYLLPPNRRYPAGRVAYISNMFTYREYRNQGIATKLFAMTVEEARKRGCGKVLLTATDMGRPLYEKYGFKDAEGDMTFYF